MDTIVRGRRIFLDARKLRALVHDAREVGALALACAIGACGGSASRVPVGVSTASEARAPQASTSTPSAQRSNAIPADYKKTMTQIGTGRFVSRGHAAGRFDVELYANEAGKSSYGSASGEFPVGARFVTAHFEKANAASPADEAPGPLFMMEKMAKGFDAAHGDWRYVALSSQGALVQEGKIESCAGCHDDAPHDHVFVIE